ncbi:DNA and RNA helicase [Aneurinibacillus thermoaerophilus]|uniref:DNA and RNA helicase n=1 Tax=Aneurinibacillus thermoaerophilus TaxID=143495 RepID=UPI002E1BFAC7|nr:DNA and RNA helicase [Aneurinibacillus thermoaerophilus]MED0766273.1 DNA and RNA helicase [Aneurinibacillus thermoaerophilus]
MFLDLYPNFKKGRILKKEMLESLRDYPRNFIDIRFRDYSDGIVAGADVLIGRDHLTITSGIVKHKGRIYMLENEYRLPYEAVGTETVLKIRFKEEVVYGDFTSYHTEIVLDDDVQVQHDELELGRFKLKEGARLRSEYKNFDDFATEYNTFNIIHVEYAAFRKSTFSPVILRYFAMEMLKSGSTHPYDVGFSMQCMNQGSVDRELILYYLANRLGTEYKEYSNVQIHKYLGRILADVKGGIRTKVVSGGRQRIIID